MCVFVAHLTGAHGTALAGIAWVNSQCVGALARHALALG